MTEHDEPEMVVLVIHESVAASIIKDTYSLGMLIAVMMANYYWGEGNWAVNALAAFLSLLFVLSKGSKVCEVSTLGELRKFVDIVEEERKCRS